MGGACSACCGNKDSNEIVTEKQMRAKGVHSENPQLLGNAKDGSRGQYPKDESD